jgi:hypothetical protein
MCPELQMFANQMLASMLAASHNSGKHTLTTLLAHGCELVPAMHMHLYVQSGISTVAIIVSCDVCVGFCFSEEACCAWRVYPYVLPGMYAPQP